MYKKNLFERFFLENKVNVRIMNGGFWVVILIIIIIIVLIIAGWLFYHHERQDNSNGKHHKPSTVSRLGVKNSCQQTLWIQQQNLPNDDLVIKLEPGETHEYSVPDEGVAAVRIWPKQQCDSTGNNCLIGQAIDPCPAGGCQPPIDTKFEATFAPIGSSMTTSYDVSLVDGFTLPVKVTPIGTGVGQNTCIKVDCGKLDLNQCPTSDDLSGGNPQYAQYSNENLQVVDSQNNLIGCISPCKKLNYPAPWGNGLSESTDPTLHMCCPTPAGTAPCTWANSCATPALCSAASDPLSVVNTQYVENVSSMCPNAYSYTYDDFSGPPVNLSCPAEVRYEIEFCPAN